MVETDSKIMSQGEVAAERSNEQQPKNQMLQSLGRQLSIYSLTLDEFQNTLTDNGKSFGSMNMDEFLNSIWTAEENQADATNYTTTFPTSVTSRENNISMDKGLLKQHSLTRQSSLTIPEPLCKKTVDEVWSEITNSQQNNKNGQSQSHDPNMARRQATIGEMTLEDFLVRAGIVREPNFATAPPPQHPGYGNYQNTHNAVVAPHLVAKPLMSSGMDVAAYERHPQEGVSYGGRMGNGSGGGFGLVIGSPVSPVSSDGLCGNGVDMIGGGVGGRRKLVDEPVVERRQRRMIKNRESAARSRARKQAYTVELEAELNQLKEENAHLKQALAGIERKRRQQYYEEARKGTHTQAKAGKANEKPQTMRRTLSCSY